jgi:hypothetical protein
MPNWCNNFVRISHSDTAKIEALAEAVREGKFCDHVIPVPEDLQIVAGRVGDDTDPAQIDLEAKEKSNLEKYGAANWYDYCVGKWGTKWDVDPYDPRDVIIEDNTIQFGFDSAWSPPIGVYEVLVEQGFEVEATYYESGMGYCGVWQDGCDDYYDISGMSADEVADTIPEHLDEGYGISETMREYEEMEKDDLEVWYEDGVEKKGLEPHK